MPSILDHGLRTLAPLGLPGYRRVINALRPARRVASRHAAFQVKFSGLTYHGSLVEHIDREIFFFGRYAPAELDFLDQAARRLADVQAVNYFDIGANVGQHTLWMSGRVARAFAFEPSAAAMRQMRVNLAANNITNVTSFPVALGDARGEAKLGSGIEHNSGSRSLLWSLGDEGEETVQVHQGERFFADEDLPRIDILKLDVEGFEQKVLTGLAARIRRDRPVILMELIGDPACKGGFTSEADLLATLYPDCKVFALAGDKVARLKPFHWNVEEIVCIPIERLENFRDMVSELPRP